MHSAFRIRTDIYVGLGLINCVLISLEFILLQSILFVGYSAVGLDWGDILTLFNPIFLRHSCVSPCVEKRSARSSVSQWDECS